MHTVTLSSVRPFFVTALKQPNLSRQHASLHGDHTSPNNEDLQFERGKELMRGDGVEQSDVQALSYLKPIADGGNLLTGRAQCQAVACKYVGDLYFRDQGVTKNFHLAFTYYRKAIDLGMPGVASATDLGLNANLQVDDPELFNALDILAVMYLNGFGVPQNASEACKYLTLTVTLKYTDDIDRAPIVSNFHQNFEQLLNLAPRFADLKGYIAAYRIYAYLAEQGNQEALYWCAEMWLEGRPGIKQNKEKAYRIYAVLAARGDDALSLLNCVVILKDSVDREKSHQASVFIKNASALYLEKNHQHRWDACSNLGELHEIGRYVQKNMKIAGELYTKAADKNNAFSCYRLGLMYRTGEGVAQDEDKALELFQKSAELCQKQIEQGEIRGWNLLVDMRQSKLFTPTEENVTITRIDLRNRELNDSDRRCLLKMLQVSNKITSLNMAGSLKNDKDWALLIAVLQMNKSIKSLDLRGNDINIVLSAASRGTPNQRSGKVKMQSMESNSPLRPRTNKTTWYPKLHDKTVALAIPYPDKRKAMIGTVRMEDMALFEQKYPLKVKKTAGQWLLDMCDSHGYSTFETITTVLTDGKEFNQKMTESIQKKSRQMAHRQLAMYS